MTGEQRRPLARMAAWFVRRPTWTLLLFGLCVVVSLIGARTLTVDMSPRAFFAEGSVRVIDWDHHQARFGSANAPLLVLVRATGTDADVVSPTALTEMDALARALEDSPEVESVVRIAEPIARFTPMLLARDRETAALHVHLHEPDAPMRELRPSIHAIAAIVERFDDSSPLEFQLAGLPAIRVAFVEATLADQLTFVGLAVLLIAAVLAVSSRSLRGVVVPLAFAFFPCLPLLAILAIAGESIGLLNQVYLTLIPALAVADAIHLCHRYERELGRTRDGGRSIQSRRSAAELALAQVGRACLATSWTSAAAFSTLALADTPAVRSFGIYAAVGVVLAFVALIVFAPTALTWFRPGPMHPPMPRRVIRPPRAVGLRVLATVVLMAAAIPLAARAEIGTRVTATLADDHPLSEAGALVDRELGGQQIVFIELPRPRTPAELAHEREFIEWLLAHEVVRFARPEDRGEHHRLAIGVQDPGVLEFNTLRDAIEVEAARRFGTSIRLVGATVVTYAAIAQVLDEMRGGIGLLALTLLGASLLVFGLRRELIAMTLVNLLPLLLGAALLPILGWSLDLAAVVVFSIALGISTDDTIHIMARYRERLDAGDRPHAAMADSVRTTGHAVVVTTICLAIGFFLQSLSSLPQLIHIGILGGVVVTTAMLADLWLLPALVVWLRRPFDHR